MLGHQRHGSARGAHCDATCLPQKPQIRQPDLQPFPPSRPRVCSAPSRTQRSCPQAPGTTPSPRSVLTALRVSNSSPCLTLYHSTCHLPVCLTCHTCLGLCPLKGHEHCEDRASVCVRHSGGPYELLLNEPGNPGHVSGNTLVSHREHVMSEPSPESPEMRAQSRGLGPETLHSEQVVRGGAETVQ